MTLVPTRAEQCLPRGITPRTLAARSKKAIEEIEKRIDALAEPYADVDNSVEGARQELAAAFDKSKATILDTQRYLEESAWPTTAPRPSLPDNSASCIPTRDTNPKMDFIGLEDKPKSRGLQSRKSDAATCTYSRILIRRRSYFPKLVR
jgi:hypothetical protein